MYYTMSGSEDLEECDEVAMENSWDEDKQMFTIYNENTKQNDDVSGLCKCKGSSGDIEAKGQERYGSPTDNRGKYIFNMRS